MSNRIARLRSRALERDVARLADGTLVGPRRELLGRMLAGSPELERRLDEQRRALAAVRSSGTRERAPLALRIRHRRLKTGRSPRPFSRLRLSAGLAGAFAALAAILVLIGGEEVHLCVDGGDLRRSADIQVDEGFFKSFQSSVCRRLLIVSFVSIGELILKYRVGIRTTLQRDDLNDEVLFCGQSSWSRVIGKAKGT